jgi:phosphoribosylaminoimidazole-succinocarboxamide synthase
VLTQITAWWLRQFEGDLAHHMLSADAGEIVRQVPALAPHRAMLEGRSMLCRRTEVFPVECVVRGYISGSAWKEYKASGTLAGEKLPAGMVESDRFANPVFSPATKAETGHDENISFEQMTATVGANTANELRTKSLDIYRRAAEYARGRGVIIADTKFEWGRLPSGEIILIDEVLTPDSSRFWPGDSYSPGRSQPSFDKQFVRDWLESTTWDKNSPPPDLPPEVVEKTRQKYREAVERLTGSPLA